MNKLSRILDLVASVGIIVLCALLGLNLVTSRGLDFSATKDSLKGTKLPALASYSWENYPETLVLAIRSGCHFCEESLPFYRHLCELEARHKLHAHILVIAPDDAAKVQAMLRRSDINADGIFNEPLDSIKVSGTPTLMLVDRQGRITQSWVGKQSQEGEKEISNAASAATGRHDWLIFWR